MKRFLVLFLILGLTVGSIATAEAGKKKKPKRVERVVELSYDAPSPGISGVVGACLAVLGVEGTACIDTPLGASDVFVQVEVADATGRPTNFYLAQDTNADNPGLEIFASGCGKTDAPISVTPGLSLRVSVAAIGGPNCLGAATTGDIKITLSNLP